MVGANVFLVLILILAYPASAKDTTLKNGNSESKVMGGVSAEDKYDHYRHALIFVNEAAKNVRCMGNLLTWEKVLTACHCLIGPDSQSGELIVLDQSDKNQKFNLMGGLPSIILVMLKNPFSLPGSPHLLPGIQVRPAFGLIPHQSCTGAAWIWTNDVGVVTVKEAFIGLGPHAFLELMPLFSRDYGKLREKYQDYYESNRTCRIAGHGTLRSFLSGGKNVTNVMQEVEQVVVPWPICKKGFCFGKWKDICNQVQIIPKGTEHLICAYREHGQYGGPCYGDSGAALVCRNTDVSIENKVEFRGYAVAILSSGLHCGVVFGGPFFYTKLVSVWPFLRALDSRLHGGNISTKAICEMVGPPGMRKCKEGTGPDEMPDESGKSWASTMGKRAVRFANSAFLFIVIVN